MCLYVVCEFLKGPGAFNVLKSKNLYTIDLCVDIGNKDELYFKYGFSDTELKKRLLF